MDFSTVFELLTLLIDWRESPRPASGFPPRTTADEALKSINVPVGARKKLLDLADIAEKEGNTVFHNYHDEIAGAFSLLTPVLKGLQRNVSVDTEHLTYLRSLITASKGNSPSALSHLTKHRGRYSSKALNPLEDGVFNNHAASAKLLEVIYSLVGEGRPDLTMEEKEHFRKKNPSAYRKYLDAKAGVKESVNALLRSLCRKREGKVRYSTFMRSLSRLKMLSHFPPAKDWDGLIDSEGTLYTSEGLEIKGKPSFPIIGNKDYDPSTNDTYVFYVRTSMGNSQYFYTVDSLSNWREERFEAVDDFIPTIEKVRKKWLKDITAVDSRTRDKAYILELLYWCSARIGSVKNNVRGNQTFGISTLQARHISRVGSNLVIEYVGKTGVKQKHILKPTLPHEKEIAKGLMRLVKSLDPNDYIFVGDKGTPYSNSTINSYFRSKGAPQNVSVHKLRHARASKIMSQLMSKPSTSPYVSYKGGTLTRRKGAKPDQKEAENQYKEMALEVGRELGHSSGEQVTPMTAIGNYINPLLTTGYFESLNLRIPSWAKKFKQ